MRTPREARGPAREASDGRASRTRDAQPRSDASAPFAPIGWVATSVSYTYPEASKPAVADLSMEVPAGRCTAILGPNGSGKSTLLKLLLGTLAPDTGTIHLDHRPLSRWPRRELARNVGIVAQHEVFAFPLTVREMVAMGRYPHLGLLQLETETDRAAIADAMRTCDVDRFADRPLDTLSGGERQRARLARALAQQPRVLALDEPTLALDIRHEMEIFELAGRLVRRGVTVVLVTHNINLASRYADDLVLLSEGQIVAAGRAAEVLREDVLETVYEWPIMTTVHPGPGPDAGAIQATPLSRPSVEPTQHQPVNDLPTSESALRPNSDGDPQHPSSHEQG